MLKTVPELPVDAKAQQTSSVAQATRPPPAQCVSVLNMKSLIKNKFTIDIGFDI